MLSAWVRVLSLALCWCSALGSLSSVGHNVRSGDAGSTLRTQSNFTQQQDKRFISCSEQDLTFVIETSAQSLIKKFEGAMHDLRLMDKFIRDTNGQGGISDPVLREHMCCCNTEDWRELGRTSAWAGFHDCDEDRTNELFFGNASLAGGHGVFTGTRTIDTDLAFLNAAASVFPWIVDRQTETFDQDGFYAAAWAGTGGEVYSYYPGFNRIWPGHYLGDVLGGDYSGREDVFVKMTLPSENPARQPRWTPPYVDPAGAGNMISAVMPLYYDGEFRGHVFDDEYVAAMGIDILLVYMENLVEAMQPTANALPMVVTDEGHLVSAPQRVVESIFGEGITVETTIRCTGEAPTSSSRQSSCKIQDSATGDWAALMQMILASPKGERRLLADLVWVERGGRRVAHHAAAFRWKGALTPPWNSVVLVPADELSDAVRYRHWRVFDGRGGGRGRRKGVVVPVEGWDGLQLGRGNTEAGTEDGACVGRRRLELRGPWSRWEAPQVLEAETREADGEVLLQVTLKNTGTVDLMHRPRTFPAFATIVQGPATPEQGAVLQAGSEATYALKLSAAQTTGRGTHSQTMVWELRDDGYPDCVAQEEVDAGADGRERQVTVVINFVVDPADNSFIVIIVAVVGGVVAVGLLVAVYGSVRQRHADAIWSIAPRDLHLFSPPEVLGRGTFGMVVAAEYRKTRVAVKRVIPPAAVHKGLFGGGEASVRETDPLDALFLMPPPPQNESKRLSTPAPHTPAPHAELKMQLVHASSCSPPTISAEGTPAPVMGAHHRTQSASTHSSGHEGWQDRLLGRTEHDKLKRMFVAEMRLLSKMRHPCITTVMGAVIDKSCEPMLVMELMDHGSLYDLIHNRTVLFNGELVLPILLHVAQGLTFLHHHPIVHGDIKSANVLVDSQFRGKVADFGASSKKWASSTPCGTPYWMAPELLRGQRNSPPTDVYAFGITLWEVYSRQEPYANEDPEQVLAAVAHGTEGGSDKRPEIPASCPPEVGAIMGQCWHRDPALRPSCEEVQRMLQILDVNTMGPEADAAQGKPEEVEDSGRGRWSVRGGQSQSVMEDMFPKHVAGAIMRGEQVPEDRRECATVMFTDIVGFTNLSSILYSHQVSDMLHRLFTKLDALAEQHGVYKLETIGDCYIAVTNLVEKQDGDHAIRMARFALGVMAACKETPVCLERPELGSVTIRSGFDTGPLVGAIVGTKHKKYTIFGNTVNTASRMESTCVSGKIQCTEAAALLIKQQRAPGDTEIRLEARGQMAIKGKGRMSTFFVEASGGGGGDDTGPAPRPAELEESSGGSMRRTRSARRASEAGSLRQELWRTGRRRSSLSQISVFAT